MLAGAPVVANDDAPGGLSLSTLPAGSAFGPIAAGRYDLAVSMSGYDPINSSGQAPFALPVASTDVCSPASGLQPARLGGWDGAGFDTIAAYTIQPTGAAVAEVPEPISAFRHAVGQRHLPRHRRRRRCRQRFVGRPGGLEREVPERSAGRRLDLPP